MKLIRVLGCMGALAASSQAYAIGANLMVEGKYSTLKNEKEDGQTEDPEDKKGFGGSASIQLKFMDAKAANLFLGLGVDYKSVESEKDGFTDKLTRIALPVELGVSLNVIPMMTLQLSGVYEHGLSGKAEYSTKGAAAAAMEALGFPTSRSEKLKDDSAYGANARVLFTMAPLVRAGITAQYTTGSYKVENSDGEKNKYSAYAIGLALGISL